MKKLVLQLILMSLSACSILPPERYSTSTDNNIALRAIGSGNINVGSITKKTELNTNCRGFEIMVPDNMSFESYIQKALTDELKVEGMFEDKEPKITLTGIVENMDLSTWIFTGLWDRDGYWDIGLHVNSSNGKTTYVSEHYKFNSGSGGNVACSKAGNAFKPAVQNLLNKLFTSPDFKALVTPASQTGR